MASASRSAQMEVERLRAVLQMQGVRIRELETSIFEEHERTNAFREQIQAVNGRLIQIVREVRD